MVTLIKNHWVHITVVAAVGLVFVIVASFMSALESWDKESARSREDWKQNPKNPVNICIERGGVPVVSAWNGELEDCQFNPYK